MSNPVLIGRRDALPAGDPMSAGPNMALLENEALKGQVLVEVFTAPENDLDLPLILGADLAKMRVGIFDSVHPEELAERQVTDAVSPLLLQNGRFEDSLGRLLSMRRHIELVPNLITQIGDQYYGERAAGIAGPPAQVAAMKLGTGSTAVAKTGAGAALITYLAGSDKAIDGSWPTSALNGSSRQIQWKTSWGAGVINGSALREVVIVNDLADATSAAADTYSRALFGPITLGALDTMSVTWNHLLLGA